MSFNRVKRAAFLRDLVIEPRNSWGWYVIWTGGEFFRFDTLQGAYRFIMCYPRVY